MKYLLMWLLGYRKCSFCKVMKWDTKAIVCRTYDDYEIVGYLCVGCFIKKQNEFTYYGG